MKLSTIKFDFNIPRISFGIGKINDLGRELLNILKPIEIEIPKVLIVSGKESLRKSGHLNAIRINLEKLNIHFEIYDKVNKEPTTSIVNNGRDIFLKEKCNITVGIGGGSALDSAKAIAGLVTNGGTIEDYHAGKEFIKAPIPFILCPTTSGTGSEVSNNAVIIDEKKGIKQSVRGLWTNLALLDPELTLFLPKSLTAQTSADAPVQAIESLVSKGSNFISDLFAKESIKLLGENLPKVYDDLNNIELRENMMLGSLLDGISFANGKLGAVHGFAHPIGVKY
ncbi:MAG TPA: iron-containing alcohol dehydrogenase, partial [Candidatus Lokiarchaeia archaeon]